MNGAARALKIPRSTISRRLARLEAQLGVRLFHRTAQRLSLSEAGERLLARARAIVEHVEDLVDDAQGVSTTPRGRLRVSAPLDLSGDPSLWLDLFARYPEVSFEVELTNRYVDVVREGYDLAMRAGRGDDESLTLRRLGAYELFAVASPEYVRRHGRLREPRDLRAHSCLLLSPLTRRPGETSPKPPHRHLVLDDAQTVLQGALRGMGIAILPRALVGEHLERGALLTVLDAYAPLTVPLYAVYPDRTLLPATVRVFIEHMQRTFGGASASPG